MGIDDILRAFKPGEPGDKPIDIEITMSTGLKVTGKVSHELLENGLFRDPKNLEKRLSLNALSQSPVCVVLPEADVELAYKSSDDESGDQKALLLESKSTLRFRLAVEQGNELIFNSFPFSLQNKLNSTAWGGKEPGSCKIVHIGQQTSFTVGKSTPPGYTEIMVWVGYRPPGWITGVRGGGRQRHNGWMLELRDEKKDGTLLDGHDNPLPDGAEPVYLPPKVYEAVDFNDYDFGTFFDEVEHDK